jgi:hypothetical protein
VKWILPILILLCAISARAQSFVKAASNSVVGTATTVTISTTANDAIVVIAYEGVNSTSTLSISDSTGTNTYTQAGGYVTVSGDRFAMFYDCQAAAVTSVTATWSGSISATVPVVVFEISGLAASGCLDPHSGNPVSSTQTNGTHSSFASGTLSTTNANDILLFGMGAGTNLSSEAAGSGFTLPSGGNASNGRAAMIYKVVAATQTNTSTSITFTSTTVQNTGLFAAFSTTGSGASCTPTLTLLGMGRCG